VKTRGKVLVWQKNSTDFELKTILKDSEIEETTEKG